VRNICERREKSKNAVVKYGEVQICKGRELRPSLGLEYLVKNENYRQNISG